MDTTNLSAEQLAATIDHTLLKPEAQGSTIDQLCEEAKEYGFAAVCVNGLWIGRVAKALEAYPSKPCAVVGFPLGASSPVAVAEEARIAIDQGAQEIDMVMSIGDALDENWNAVREGIARVRQSCAEVPLKVILETCLLSTEQKRRACEVCVEVGVAFVKTSTGFAGGGATAEDVALMRETVGDEMGVKASGGIRDRDSALAMLRAGANRLGCSAGVAIVTGGVGTGSY
ncbi:MAG: deoxyribose-phosphate aldolase [Pseudomonadota bacterium]